MSLYDKESPLFLDQCLESLDLQTLPATEIILVYDGPINNKLDSVVKKWTKKLPIQIIKLKNNIGLGKALNKGLQFCKYDFVARMDSDDICRPDRFKIQINHLKDNPHIDVLGSWISEFSTSPNSPHSLRRVPLNIKDIKNFAKKRNPINHVTVFFKKASVLSAGGYQHCPYMEDYLLWLKMMGKGFHLESIDSSLVLVRTGDDMLKRRGGIDYIKSELAIYKVKNKIKLTKPYEGYFTFILRSGTRLLNTHSKKMIYKHLRGS